MNQKKVSGNLAGTNSAIRVPGLQNAIFVIAAPEAPTTTSAPRKTEICSSKLKLPGSTTVNPLATRRVADGLLVQQDAPLPQPGTRVTKIFLLCPGVTKVAMVSATCAEIGDM